MAISTLFSNDSTFRIPLVPSRITLRQNPAYMKVKHNIDHWCLEYVDPCFMERDLIVQGKYGLLASFVYPTAPAVRLETLGKFCASLFLIDDDTDRQHSGASSMKAILAHHKDILKGSYDSRLFLEKNPGANKLLRKFDMVDALWKDLAGGLSCTVQVTRMFNHLSDTFDSAEVELSWIKGSIVPTVEDFIQLRRKTSAVLPAFALIEYACYINVKLEALHAPEIKEIERIGVDHVMLTNDLMSFNKEWADGGYLNIVPVLAYNMQCGLHEAISEACRIVGILERDYLRIYDKILADPMLAGVPGLMDYVHGIGDWITGNQEWGWLTRRYNSLPSIGHEHNAGERIFMLNKFGANVL